MAGCFISKILPHFFLLAPYRAPKKTQVFAQKRYKYVFSRLHGCFESVNYPKYSSDFVQFKYTEALTLIGLDPKTVFVESTKSLV